MDLKFDVEESGPPPSPLFLWVGPLKHMGLQVLKCIKLFDNEIMVLFDKCTIGAVVQSRGKP